MKSAVARTLTPQAIFIGALVIAGSFQSVFWTHAGIYDAERWGNEALYVETGDPRQFNTDNAYGHPGGPLILGTIAIHRLTGASYLDSLFTILTVGNSLIIAGISALCFALRKNGWWSLVATIVLSANHLYLFSTPPSAVASLLAVLLSLIVLLLYEHTGAPLARVCAICGIISGTLIATRADIGIVLTVSFALTLLLAHKGKGIAIAFFSGLLTFFALDPFMWFMPLQHLLDMWQKVRYHYAEIGASHLPAGTLLSISFPLIMAVALTLFFLFVPKKLPFVLPRGFLYALLIMTAGLYGVFLTAHLSTVRYFMPIIFIWETLLPLFLFSLARDSVRPFVRPMANLTLAALLTGYELSVFFIEVV